MTSNASALGNVMYKTESAWGENDTSMGSAVRLPIITPVDLSGLTHEMLDPQRTVQYLDDGTKGIPGPMGGSFSFGVWLTGHGSATSGATSTTALGDLLGWAMGAVAASSAAGTTESGSASTTTSIATTAANGFSAGSMLRIGAKGDGRADGQWNVATSHAANALAVKFAMPAAPTNGDVVHSAETVSTLGLPTSGPTAKRFRLQTANLQFTTHGNAPTSLKFSGLSPGEVPRADLGVTCSWFQPVAATFPDTTSNDTFTPSPIAAGSFCFGTRGATTRTTYSIRACELDFNLGMEMLPAVDTVSPYQKFGGARRKPSTCIATLTVDSPAASTTPTIYDLWLTNAEMHALFSWSTAAGQALGGYFSRCCFTGNRPIQTMVDGLNRTTFQIRAYTDLITTTDLTLAMFKLGLA